MSQKFHTHTHMPVCSYYVYTHKIYEKTYVLCTTVNCTFSFYHPFTRSVSLLIRFCRPVFFRTHRYLNVPPVIPSLSWSFPSSPDLLQPPRSFPSSTPGLSSTFNRTKNEPKMRSTSPFHNLPKTVPLLYHTERKSLLGRPFTYFLLDLSFGPCEPPVTSPGF